MGTLRFEIARDGTADDATKPEAKKAGLDRGRWPRLAPTQTPIAALKKGDKLADNLEGKGSICLEKAGSTGNFHKDVTMGASRPSPAARGMTKSQTASRPGSCERRAMRYRSCSATASLTCRCSVWEDFMAPATAAAAMKMRLSVRQ